MHGWEGKIRICKQYFYKKDRRLGELNEKIKRKAHVKQSFSLDFLERGTFTEYPYVIDGCYVNRQLERKMAKVKTHFRFARPQHSRRTIQPIVCA